MHPLIEKHLKESPNQIMVFRSSNLDHVMIKIIINGNQIAEKLINESEINEYIKSVILIFGKVSVFR